MCRSQTITYYKKKAKSNRWMTKGIKISCHRMRFLNKWKVNSTLTSEVFDYISRYHLIHKRVISEAKKEKNDRLVKSTNYSTKVMWQLINKHMGKLYTLNQDSELKNDWGKITNPQTVAETLNSFYTDCVEDLLVQNKAYIQMLKWKLNITQILCLFTQ